MIIEGKCITLKLPSIFETKVLEDQVYKSNEEDGHVTHYYKIIQVMRMLSPSLPLQL